MSPDEIVIRRNSHLTAGVQRNLCSNDETVARQNLHLTDETVDYKNSCLKNWLFNSLMRTALFSFFS